MRATTACLLMLLVMPAQAADSPPEATLKFNAKDLDGIAKAVGKPAEVTGKIEATKDLPSGKIIFLNFGQDYKKAFTVVIHYAALPAFEKAGIKAPAEHYKGKTVTATGTITLYKERPQIEAKDPAQIKDAPTN